LWVNLVSFAAITICVASQRVFIVVSVYFVITHSGNLDTPSYLVETRLLSLVACLRNMNSELHFLKFKQRSYLWFLPARKRI
jgi:hypothetical protein